MKSKNKFVLAALLMVCLAGCVGYVGGGGASITAAILGSMTTSS